MATKLNKKVLCYTNCINKMKELELTDSGLELSLKIDMEREALSEILGLDFSEGMV